jgi:hypothetical protein
LPSKESKVSELEKGKDDALVPYSISTKKK